MNPFACFLALSRACSVSPAAAPANQEPPMEKAAVKKADLTKLYQAAKTALARLEAVRKQQPSNRLAIERMNEELGVALKALVDFDGAAAPKTPQDKDKAAPRGQDAQQFSGTAPPAQPSKKGQPASEADRRKGQEGTDKFLKKPLPEEGKNQVPIESVPVERRSKAFQEALKVQQRVRQLLQAEQINEASVTTALADLRHALEGVVTIQDQSKPK